MLFKNKFRKRSITPDEEDKPFMIESLVFIILMTICAWGLVYALVHLIMFIAETVTVDMMP